MSGRRVRAATALVWVLAGILVLPTLVGGSGAAVGGTPSVGGGFDRSVAQADCSLLGRVYVAARGCARSRCVPGAVVANPNLGAEVCATRRDGRPYGEVIDARLCTSLGRVFVASANYCASHPDRDDATVPQAPQCAARGQTYVTLEETEGHYDECLPPDRVEALAALAATDGTTLAQEVDQRSAVQCGDRPGRVFVDGLCQASDAPPPATSDQVLLIGDSLGWRSSNELGELRPELVIDAVPSRRIEELRGRLDAYRSVHGAPSGLIVELGTNASAGYAQRDLQRTVRSLPRSTRLMFVLPYRTTSGARAPTYGRWMRDLARQRARTCVVDWPSAVRQRPGLLVDDVHPTSRAERVYAGLVLRGWTRC